MAAASNYGETLSTHIARGKYQLMGAGKYQLMGAVWVLSRY